jgi:hypothetical protein
MGDKVRVGRLSAYPRSMKSTLRNDYYVAV